MRNLLLARLAYAKWLEASSFVGRPVTKLSDRVVWMRICRAAYGVPLLMLVNRAFMGGW